MTEQFTHFINDRFVSSKDATLSIHDLSITRGFAVFDFTRTYNRAAFHLEDHLSRFFASAKRMHLSIPYHKKELIAITQKLIKKNPNQELAIKFLLSPGISEDGFSMRSKPTLIIYAMAITKFPQTQTSLRTYKYERTFPNIKTTFYLPAITKLREVQKEGFDDCLYIDTNGYILEASRSNFFAFIDNKLVTPNKRILHGVTRSVILHLAKDLFPIELRDIHMDEVKYMDEAFVTSTLKELMPVKKIDRQVFLNKLTNTKILMKKFANYTKQSHWENLQSTLVSHEI